MAKFHHVVQHMANHKKKENSARGKGDYIKWPQLSLIGIGSIIGAGFFLGTGLSIKIAGPSVLIGYLIAGIAAFFTFAALAEMTVNDPQEGSFRTYAQKAYGRGFGFVSGWLYWFAGLLIMSSEITALSTFAQYWFHSIPLWVFSAVFAFLGFGIIMLGVSDFGKIESLFALVKLSTLIIIIIFGGLLLFGFRPSAIGSVNMTTPFSAGLFPNGVMGLWTGLIFVLFSFGGIAVVGVTAKELKNKDQVPKAGYTLIITLLSVYILSLAIVLSLTKWSAINESESPFVTALSNLHIPALGTVFNIVIITAAFSTMIGALYSITNIMVSLAEDHAAPVLLSKRNKKGVAFPALGLTAVVLAITIIVSYFLPKSVYEYLTASAGVMLLLNWVIILLSQLKNRKSYKGNHYKMPLYPISNFLSILIILIALTGALFQKKELVGVVIAVSIAVLITLIYWISSKVRRPN